MVAASYDNWIGLGIGLLLLVLMVTVLMAPERF